MAGSTDDPLVLVEPQAASASAVAAHAQSAASARAAAPAAPRARRSLLAGIDRAAERAAARMDGNAR
ncbi:MAG TPA: hypothetical protein VG366_01150, partial [Solirubrobacteraceae bacterium]|nr:hypothetical protein [Solirubrobacteraceae bacterium]